MHSLAVNGTPCSGPTRDRVGELLLGCSRLLQRLLVARQHDDVEVLHLLCAVDVGLDQLHRADLAVANGTRHVGGGAAQDVVHATAGSGRRSCHGCAASSWADSDSSSSSPAGGPTSCTPTGRPSARLVQRQRDRRLPGHVPHGRERHPLGRVHQPLDRGLALLRRQPVDRQRRPADRGRQQHVDVVPRSDDLACHAPQVVERAQVVRRAEGRRDVEHLPGQGLELLEVQRRSPQAADTCASRRATPAVQTLMKFST